MSGLAVTLGLVSHTNVGKTTLARTLLRRDVGEVRDEAHVTEDSEVHTLIEGEGACLRLYDTPGLGDTARLLTRLRRESNPLGWFLTQVWDRIANRPLWCSQQAIRTARDEVDVILYLVNAAEEPEAAGYVRHEFDLLTWVHRPVLILLNQTGPARPRGAPAAEAAAPQALEGRWRALAAPWPIVRDVLSLDAFTRCWVHEGVLFERIVPLLPEAKRPAMRQCLAAWNARNQAVFQAAVARMAAHVSRAAADREPIEGDLGSAALGRELWLLARGRRRAMRALRERLEGATRRLVGDLLADHGLHGRSTVRLRERLQDFRVTGSGWTPRWGAAVGGAVSGALGGLAADLTAGGLTFGGGLVAGALLGALGGAGLTHAYRLVQGEGPPEVSWSDGFLRDLCRQTVLRYLVVAHFGRGRGGYEDVEMAEGWRELVEEVLAPFDHRMAGVWRVAARDAAARSEAAAALEAVLAEGTRAVLLAGYPEARPFLGATPGFDPRQGGGPRGGEPPRGGTGSGDQGFGA